MKSTSQFHQLRWKSAMNVGYLEFEPSLPSPRGASCFHWLEQCIIAGIWRLTTEHHWVMLYMMNCRSLWALGTKSDSRVRRGMETNKNMATVLLEQRSVRQPFQGPRSWNYCKTQPFWRVTHKSVTKQWPETTGSAPHFGINNSFALAKITLTCLMNLSSENFGILSQHPPHPPFFPA